ncbi:Zinc-binding alcohol dehydrogenase [Streptomyces venezuelae]|uniref:NADP-dependent oxidoreductase n=1 Tax=Streptomyces gardneri TaxID=66892 RepID=UPI0006BDECDA|nr:NADP-dependent oxidoreductase [Streptomyces gardneri]ALO09415.1 Zinc-binding alcohol dehydrogenase [Streptomyces venezuelae]QPK46522.1 NADP-dependent oxidoreductase [Streptomyces gardneri]WRK37911.1 NADP-dependent oxidoreductase [Streptomyces venezuelae]CUM40171.1 quinone oxidoreductase CC3759 [imported], putative [Streptomyces venezuelae]
MRVVEVTAYGGPEVLRMARRPEPEAGDVPGRVRVRLKAAGVNQADLRIRAGHYADSVGSLKPPFILGTDFAGKLLDPAPGMAVGTRVAGFVPWYDELTGEGTYAEVVQVAPEWLAPIPDDVDHTVAASLPLASAAAQQGLDRLALPEGSTLLVTGGSTVVGRLAVQYASAAGLRVVAVAHEGDESELKILGAEHALPRGTPEDVIDRVLAAVPEQVDGVFDGALLGEDIVPVLKDGGVFVAIAPDRVPAPQRNIRVEAVRAVPDATRLAESLQKVADRELITRVADVLPLEEVAEAHRRAESGHRPGRIILMI